MLCTGNFKRLWLDDIIQNGGELYNYAIEYEDGSVDTKLVTGYRDWLFNDVKKNINNISLIDNDFINGFKRVYINFFKMGFIRESDGKLMPYFFDIVSKFNNQGFAMVALGGRFGWINKDFKIQSTHGEWRDLYKKSFIFPDIDLPTELNIDNMPSMEESKYEMTMQNKSSHKF